jgi:hypothetical protein
MAMPAPMSLFHSLQFLPLFVRESGRDLSMRFVQDLTDTLASVTPHLLELRGSSIQNRRYVGYLFRCQIEFSPQPLAHSLTDVATMMKLEEKMSFVRCAHENTRQSAGEKNQEDSSDQFPFQGAIHCKNSV